MYPQVFQPDKKIPGPVVNTQSSSQGADPQIGLPVFKNAFDLVIGYRPGVFGIVPVNSEMMPIVFVQAILGTKPHKPVFVLQDTIYSTLGQPICRGKLTEFSGPPRLAPGLFRKAGKDQEEPDKREEYSHITTCNVLSKCAKKHILTRHILFLLS
jgi:hypothetical protein